MGRGKKYQPEQVVYLLRQIEVAIANGNHSQLAAPGVIADTNLARNPGR